MDAIFVRAMRDSKRCRSDDEASDRRWYSGVKALRQVDDTGGGKSKCGGVVIASFAKA
jgi:hypothetical protein